MATGAQNRHLIAVSPKQPVRGRSHHEQVFRVRANSAEDSENRLNEERRLDHAAIDEIRQIVEMPDIVALEFEASAAFRHVAKKAARPNGTGRR